jgi:hypothetical protein
MRVRDELADIRHHNDARIHERAAEVLSREVLFR